MKGELREYSTQKKKSKLKIQTEMDINEKLRGTNNNGVVCVYTHTQSKN